VVIGDVPVLGVSLYSINCPTGGFWFVGVVAGKSKINMSDEIVCKTYLIRYFAGLYFFYSNYIYCLFLNPIHVQNILNQRISIYNDKEKY
jgi:hypothetical protein